jgi:5-(carboxyamino)imidazole ribonucleotide synthase
MTANVPNRFPPGSVIGIFGSGQLGKMTATAAKEMGYRVHVYSPDHDSPAGQVADVQGSYDDLEAIENFAKQVDVITLEFENIPLKTLAAAGRHAPVHPGVETLRTAQHRATEKNFLRDLGILTCKFEVVHSLEELQSACSKIMPAVVKTTSDGYDGKGQVVIRSADDAAEAWEALGTTEAILEEWIEYDFEFSVVAARNAGGEFAAFRSFRNEHADQILDVSISPSGLSEATERAAEKVVAQIMESLQTIGMLCVEFFYRDGEILVNELAPRPHNSGHLTIEGHVTSQFAQHVRAVCNLKLGSTRQHTPAAMANILGDQWDNGQPRWHEALSVPGVKLHLYSKDVPKPKRKMGHLTAVSATADEAREKVISSRSLLKGETVNTKQQPIRSA